MKNIEINLDLNNKNLLSKYFKINESIDLSLLNDVKNIAQIFNEAKYKEIKEALCELDVFKHLTINLFKQDYIFDIEILSIFESSSKRYKINSKAFRYYDNKIYFDNDLYFYGNKIYVKDELLNKSFSNLELILSQNMIICKIM